MCTGIQVYRTGDEPGGVHLYRMLETRAGLERVSVGPASPQSFVFCSPDLDTKTEVVVLIHGSGVVRAGQWARRLIINEDLDKGTMLPYIKHIQEQGWGVAVLNTNHNKLSEDSKEMFDPATGKTYVPFEKSVKVQSIAQFMHAGHTFVLTMMGIKQEAPKVYYEFSRDIARVVEDKGPRFAQEYVDTILRFLDEKRFPSMVSLYQTGEPTRAFTELSMRLTRKEDDGKKKGDTSMIGKLTGPQGICNFGAVTKPMGGEGAGWIHRKCNRFHSNPSRPCTAGIPPNCGFPDNIVGLCAFEH